MDDSQIKAGTGVEASGADRNDGEGSLSSAPPGRVLALYEKHASALVRFGAVLCGSAQEAMQATQQALLEISAQPPQENEEEWLFRRVRQLVGVPRGSAPAEAEGGAGSGRPEEILRWLQRDDVLARLQARLTPREFEILLHRLEGASYTQISRRLNISIGTVASTLARSMKKARLLLEEEGS